MAESLFEQTKARDDMSDWVHSFVDDSREDRQCLEYIWDEVELNFLVRHSHNTVDGNDTSNPLDQLCSSGGNRTFSRLKDPETHQELMTICSKIVLALFPTTESGFVKARGVGFEDITKATNVKKLIEYAHRLPGHYWALVEWVLSIAIFGTGIVEEFWDYVEQPRTLRSTIFNPETGLSETESTVVDVPVWDDPRMARRDHRDFFPDPSQTMISRMLGAAMRFKITARQADTLAENGIYMKAATRRAMEHQSATDTAETQDKDDDETLLDSVREAHPDFQQMTGFRYIGETPWKSADGFSRREVITINGETVRDKVWPRRLPWFEGKLIPRLGSFWGIGPGEVIRHGQDFADLVKSMLADSVVLMTHPSPVVNKFANVNMERLRKPRPRYPIEVEGDAGSAIAWPNFNPPLQPAFAMYAGEKQQMREASGALDTLQGLGLGSKRFSATEAAQTFQQALDRPEMFAAVMEREYLPELGRYTLGLFQEFLPDDPEELASRVGESTIPVFLADILPKFDIEFVGTRQLNEQQQLAAMREIGAMSANPIVQQVLPWIPYLKLVFRSMGADEIAAMVGNPQMVQLQMMLMQSGQGNPISGNGNGTTESQPPLGALPAQLTGGTA